MLKNPNFPGLYSAPLVELMGRGLAAPQEPHPALGPSGLVFTGLRV